MRIVKNTRWELIVCHRARWVPVLFLGAGVAIAIAAFLRADYDTATRIGAACSALFFVFSAYILSGSAEFRFDANSRRVHWCEHRPFRQREGVFAFGEIRGVILQANDNGDASPRIVLRLLRGDMPLTPYSSVGAHEEVARCIGDWLRGHGVVPESQ
jgi:hypothetical protein